VERIGKILRYDNDFLVILAFKHYHRLNDRCAVRNTFRTIDFDIDSEGNYTADLDFNFKQKDDAWKFFDQTGSTSIAADMAESTKQLAKSKGVMPSAVMKDVAKSSKAFAEYGKDGGKNIAEAAVAAARLGVNMDSLTKVADHLLDFESSITDELELGAMLGRNINLNNARDLAYRGQIGAAVKDALHQLGGIDAYNKMDVFQKRQAAKALGLSTEELDKMVKNQDKLNDDGWLRQLFEIGHKGSIKAMIETGDNNTCHMILDASIMTHIILIFRGLN
jgi:hypothetical protein